MESHRSHVIHYTPPSVDNLVNNLPDVLKSSRQFLPWVPREGKKVPLKANGNEWGNYNDPTGWRTFPEALDLLDRGKAFGVGLVLSSQQDAASLPDFNLITGIVAVDGDAKRSPVATPYNVPENISSYIRSLRSYSEYSTSLMGQRVLVFGTIPTQKQHMTKTFGDGTELGLYRAGWVTLSGLALVDSFPTIEHRQHALDQIVCELWPPADIELTTRSAPKPISFAQNFVLDWNRTVSDARVRQFIQGHNRTPN